MFFGLVRYSQKDKLVVDIAMINVLLFSVKISRHIYMSADTISK